MKTLLVLRHAKSSWNDASLDDHERPLNARGRRDAPRMGDLLRDSRLLPDLIVASDAVRAHTTAMAVAEAAHYDGQLIVEPRLYHASADEIVSVVQSIRDKTANTVMIVGHNPGLENFVELLTGESPDLPTAALVQLAVPISTWHALTSQTRATLVALWRPKELV